MSIQLLRYHDNWQVVANSVVGLIHHRDDHLPVLELSSAARTRVQAQTEDEICGYGGISMAKEMGLLADS